jgi:DNA-directed RNA polymerase subunit beta'
MMAPDNIFLPSSGKPVTVPSQDMILGLYYIMHDPLYSPEEHGKKTTLFGSTEEVLTALYGGCSFNRLDDKKEGARADDLGPRPSYPREN